MNRKSDAIVFAALTLILFVGIPLYVLNMQPTWIGAAYELGIDLRGLITPLIYLGLVMAALTIGVGFTEPHQVLNLVMRLVSVGLGLFFILLLLGAGDISSFGLESITINRGNTQVIVTIDMRLILYITVASTLLKLVEVILGFREARSELSADIPKASP